MSHRAEDVTILPGGVNEVLVIEAMEGSSWLSYVPKKTPEIAGKRLHDDATRRRQQLDMMQCRHQAQELQSLPFQPSINAKSKLVLNRDPVRENQLWQERRIAKAEALRRQKEAEEQRSLTFSPRICTASRMVADRQHFDPETSKHIPVESRLFAKGADARSKRQERADEKSRDELSRTPLRRMADNDIHHVVNRLFHSQSSQSAKQITVAKRDASHHVTCTFSPQLSRRTKAMVGDCIPTTRGGEISEEVSNTSRSGSASRSVYDRLASDAASSKAKREYLKRQAEEERKQLADVSRYIGPYSRLLAEVHNAHEISQENLPHYASPKLSKDKISSCTTVRASTPTKKPKAELMRHVDELFQKGKAREAAIERKRQVLREAEDAQLTPQRQRRIDADRLSLFIQHQQRWEESRKVGIQRKRQELQTQRQSKEAEHCTFHPETTHGSKSPCATH